MRASTQMYATLLAPRANRKTCAPWGNPRTWPTYFWPRRMVVPSLSFTPRTREPTSLAVRCCKNAITLGLFCASQSPSISSRAAPSEEASANAKPSMIPNRRTIHSPDQCVQLSTRLQLRSTWRLSQALASRVCHGGKSASHPSPQAVSGCWLPLPTPVNAPRSIAVTATVPAPATAAYTAFRQSKVPRRILESRGEPAGFASAARGVPSREGLARPSLASGEEVAGGGPKGGANPFRVPITTIGHCPAMTVVLRA